MANKSINSLEPLDALATDDLLAVWDESASQTVKMSGQQMTTWLTNLADGHGGIASITWTTSGTSGNGQYHYATIHYADDSTSTFTIRDGIKGNTGAQTYVHIKYAQSEPTQNSDMSDIPDKWMGIYTGTSSSAPSSYTSYTWYEIKGDKGDTGESISTIVNTSSVGLVDTYTMYTDSGTSVGTFSVTNGDGGVSTVDGIAPDGNGDVKTIYSTVSDLELTVGAATISGAFSALPSNASLICPATDFANAQLPSIGGTAQTTGTVEMSKSSGGSWIEYHGEKSFTMALASGTPSGTWDRVVKTSDFTIVIKSGTSKTLAAGANDNLTIDITESGKTPIAIVGARSGNNSVEIGQFYFQSSLEAANIVVINHGSSSVTFTPDVRVMYIPK